MYQADQLMHSALISNLGVSLSKKVATITSNFFLDIYAIITWYAR